MLTDLNPDVFSPIVQAIVYDSALSCLIISNDGRLAFVNQRLAADMQFDAGSPADAGEWLDVCPRPAGLPSGAAPEEAVNAGGSASSLHLVLERVLGGQSWAGELLLHDRSGKISHQQAMLTPIPDTLGRPAGVLGILKPLQSPSTDGEVPVRTARMVQPAARPALLDAGEGLRQAGNDRQRYEQRLLRFSAAYENAAEDLQGLLRHDDRIQIRCYLETLRAASDAIGSEQAARLASELIQLADSPDSCVPTPIIAIFENLMLSLQEAILDALEQRSRRHADACPPELDRRLGAVALDRMMQDLMSFLQNYDLNAIDAFGTLMEGARGVPVYRGIELAKPYLESFAFEKALRIVESVWSRVHPEAEPVEGTLAAKRADRSSRRPPHQRSAMPDDDAPRAGSVVPACTATIMDDFHAMIGCGP